MAVHAAVTGRSFWSAFRGSRLWQGLRRIGPLRGWVYLVIELRALLRDPGDDPAACERDFARRDPWNFDGSPSEAVRFARMRELVAPAHGASSWSTALEIGCAEGAFTELLAPACRDLLCVDVSPTALDRARTRKVWGSHVRFESWNMRRDVLPGTFDLVVAACVLEYVASPSEMRRMRDRIVDMVNPGGRLLVVSTRRHEIVENAWWGRRLARGRWLNAVFEEHHGLNLLLDECGATHAYALLEKRADA